MTWWVSFVGRQAELDTLGFAAGEARAGRGRLVLVAGEAGVGKTRLCTEFADRCRDEGMAVAWTACWEDSPLPAYWPVVQLCEQLGAAVDRPDSGVDDAESARAGLFAAFGAAVREASKLRPCLLVVDDVQWADRDSRRLLAFLGSVARTMPVLVAGTYRTDHPGHAAVPDELRRHASLIELFGLDRAQIAALATEVSDHAPPTAWIDWLYDSTAGNPLFASALLRQLSATIDLRQDATDLLALRLPPTVRAVLDERLAELDSGTRRVLEAAAIAGATVDATLVAAATGLPAPALLAHLDRASHAGVIADDGGGRLRFTHPLFRTVLVDNLGVAQRCRLHRCLAEALEAAPQDGDPRWLDAVASHYLAAAPAGAAREAVAFGERAARVALDAFAYERAAELFDRVLHVDRLAPGTVDRIGVLLGAGQARMAAGDVDGGRAALVAAADRARAADRPHEVARAALALAGAGFEVPLFDRAQLELLEEAYAALGETDPGLRARIAARLSVALSLIEAAGGRRARLAEEAVRAAGGDDAAMAQALSARCDVRAGPDDIRERADDARTIVRLASARGDVGTELVGRRLSLVAAFEAGDMAAVDAEIAAFAAHAERLARPQYQWYVHLWRGARAIMRGRIADYQTNIQLAETLGHEARSVNCDILTTPQRWFAAIELGQPVAALALAEDRVPLGRWFEMGPQMLPLDIGRRFLAGRLEEARAVLDAGMPPMRAAAVDAEWLTMVAQVGVLAAALQAEEHLPWIYDALTPYADMWSLDGIGSYSHGPVHRQLGVIAAALGRRRDAAEHFDAALRANERAGADLLVARTLLDRGRALAEPDALVEARRRYTALGVDGRVEEIDRPATPTSSPEVTSASFRRSGDHWQISFGGGTVTVRDSKGMHDLAALLAQPHRELAAADLVAPGGTVVSRSPGPAIDEQARAAYKRRIVDIDAQLDEADAASDSARSSRLSEERDLLVAQLAGAYGLGGRARRTGEPAERARTAVTARIRDAVRRIETQHPALGRHLARSVRTGTFCTYDPEQTVDWQL